MTTRSRPVLASIEDDPGSVVGYLWSRPNTEARSVFINDFYVLPDHRGHGYGKAALQALKRTLKVAGFDQMKQRVAADNGRARHVYEATGFPVTGVNMSKDISQKPS